MKVTKAQRAIDKRAMEIVGAEPLKDEEILHYLQRVQKASLQWMTECAENMKGKGVGAAIMLFDKSTAELVARTGTNRKTGATINLVFKSPEIVAEVVEDEENERDEQRDSRSEKDDGEGV